uniref:Uncharacterized protein n=1 Tax=Oryza sativa subsp. japonica TaxID=39947 RepID=Q6YSE7_ORYSJ|nr:hypothetical protein [Oryza sativa Japonica Group]
MGRGGEEREREGSGPSRPKKGRGEKKTFRDVTKVMMMLEMWKTGCEGKSDQARLGEGG